jgi:hypothetical protein
VVPAGLVLAWAGLALPWATLTGGAVTGVVEFRGGDIGIALGCVGIATSVVTVVGTVLGHLRTTTTVVLVLGILAVVGAVVVTLHSIYLANSYLQAPPGLVVGVGWSDTSHAAGVAVGGVASVVIVVVAAVVRAGMRDGSGA